MGGGGATGLGISWHHLVAPNKKTGGLEKGTTSVVEGWIWANSELIPSNS